MRFYWPIAKVDAEQRMVWGYASTEAEDDQGESVTREALAAALDGYMRFANIREMHRNSAVGVAKEAEIDGKGLYLGAKIVDDDAWRKVVEGVYKGFSIGGRITARDPSDRRIITGLTLTEISVVDRPANPEAVFDCWKRADGPAAGDNDDGADADAAIAAEDDPHAPVEYADPGYQPDAKRRYPIDSERYIRAAWAFIHQAHNAQRYTPGQLARIKARIADAWRRKIDPSGPPEMAPAPAATGKGACGVGRLAQVIADLDRLRERLAAEGAPAAGEPPPAQQLQAVIRELCSIVGSAAVTETRTNSPLPSGQSDPASARLAAAALPATLRKAPQPEPTPLAAALAKLSGEIMPRLDALQKRVDEIARTPLPPQTAARGFAGLSKREDGGGSDAPAADIVGALARMSEEERTLTLIKAAHATPIAAGRRPAAPATR